MGDVEQCTPYSGCFTIPSWPDFCTVYIAQPVVVQLVVTLLLLCVHPVYRFVYLRQPSLRNFVDAYIGSDSVPYVSKPMVRGAILMLQVIISILYVGIFAVRTYTRHYESLLSAEYAWSVCIAAFYIVNRWSSEFAAKDAWNSEAFVDVLTIVPPFLVGWNPMPESSQWLNLSYLRAYRALSAYDRLTVMVDFTRYGISNLQRAIVHSILKVACMIVIFSGTIMVCEILGPFESIHWTLPENYIDAKSGFGRVSFVQMGYWVVTTVSTVGYGDYSPQTDLSRLLIVVFIFVGLGIFSNELTVLMEAKSAENFRTARFVPNEADNYKYHVVVAGGGVGVWSNTMETLLSDMLSDDTQAAHVPDLVLLSQADFDPLLVDYVKKDVFPRLVRKVHFLIGDVMQPADQMRACIETCAMVLVVPDMLTSDPEKEDRKNIWRCLKVREHYAAMLRKERQTKPRHLEMRLMVLQPESRNLAISLGIKGDYCFSAQEIKSNLISQSVYVKGLIPCVAGLLQVTTDVEISKVKRYWAKELRLPDHKWFTEEYLEGLKWNIYGFVLAAQYAGMTFGELSKTAYAESKGKMLVIGVLDTSNGQIVLNYEGELTAQQLMISIALGPQDVVKYDDPAEVKDWREVATSQANRAVTPSRLEFRKAHLTKLLTMGTFDPTAPYISTERIAEKITSGGSEGTPAEPPGAKQGQPARSASNRVEQLMGTESVHPVHGEHVVMESKIFVLIIGSNFWQEVVALLRNLRSDHLSTWSHVTVLSRDVPPEAIVDCFTSAGMDFLHGDLYRPANLMGAGILDAHAVLVLRGTEEVESLSEIMSVHRTGASDSESVLLASVLDEIFLGCVRPPLRVQEFACTQSVALATHNQWHGIGRVPDFHRADTSGHPLDRGGLQSFKATNSIRPGYFVQIAELWKTVTKPAMIAFDVVRNMLCAYRETEAIDNAILRQLLFQPSFASGQAFTSDFYGGLLGRAFQFPKTVALLEELLRPHPPPSSSFPWQVTCPKKWVDKPFGDLVEAWLAGTDPEIDGVGPVVVLGLYRQIQSPEHVNTEAGFVGKYWVTLPRRSSLLRSSDLVTVVCKHDFVERAEELLWIPVPKGEELDGMDDGFKAHRSTLRKAVTGNLNQAVTGKKLVICESVDEERI